MAFRLAEQNGGFLTALASPDDQAWEGAVLDVLQHYHGGVSADLLGEIMASKCSGLGGRAAAGCNVKFGSELEWMQNNPPRPTQLFELHQPPPGSAAGVVAGGGVGEGVCLLSFFGTWLTLTSASGTADSDAEVLDLRRPAHPPAAAERDGAPVLAPNPKWPKAAWSVMPTAWACFRVERY